MGVLLCVLLLLSHWSPLCRYPRYLWYLRYLCVYVHTYLTCVCVYLYACAGTLGTSGTLGTCVCVYLYACALLGIAGKQQHVCFFFCPTGHLCAGTLGTSGTLGTCAYTYTHTLPVCAYTCTHVQ